MHLCKLKRYVCTPPALSHFPSSTVSFSRSPGIVLISTSAKKLNSSVIEIFNYHKCSVFFNKRISGDIFSLYFQSINIQTGI